MVIALTTNRGYALDSVKSRRRYTATAWMLKVHKPRLGLRARFGTDQTPAR